MHINKKKESVKGIRIINIVGIDGAGKTTLALKIVKKLRREDNNFEYKYFQYFAKLLLPLKLIAKTTIMRKTDNFENYLLYCRKKLGVSERYKVLTKIYAFIWTIDYVIQTFFRAWFPVLYGKKLVIDRYFYDVAVNISISTNNDIDYSFWMISLFRKILPVPDIIYYIDLPEEIAIKRKDDIPAIEYLKERRTRYLSLAERCNFKIISGHDNPENILLNALEFIDR